MRKGDFIFGFPQIRNAPAAESGEDTDDNLCSGFRRQLGKPLLFCDLIVKTIGEMYK